MKLRFRQRSTLRNTEARVMRSDDLVILKNERRTGENPKRAYQIAAKNDMEKEAGGAGQIDVVMDIAYRSVSVSKTVMWMLYTIIAKSFPRERKQDRITPRMLNRCRLAPRHEIFCKKDSVQSQ